MMNRTLLFVLGLALISAPARAAQISFNNLPPTVGNGTFNGFIGATVDSIFMNIVGDDFYPKTEVPSGPWEYNISTPPTLTFARFGSDDEGRRKYATAAVLLAGDGHSLAGLANVVDPGEISSYQYALWTLFSPSVSNFGNSDSLLLRARNDILLHPSLATSTAGENLRIYTPSESAASNQEFLGLSSSTGGGVAAAVPEPGTIILMGIGFLLLSIMGRKLTRRSRTKAALPGAK
jgi:hypothetical protein